MPRDIERRRECVKKSLQKVRAARKAAGLCRWCTKPRTDRQLCESCWAKHVQYGKVYYQKNRERILKRIRDYRKRQAVEKWKSMPPPVIPAPSKPAPSRINRIAKIERMLELAQRVA
jgi:hypothetical protein